MSVRRSFGMTLAIASWLTRSAWAQAPAPSPPPPVDAASVPPADDVCTSGDDTICGRLQFEAGARAYERGQYEVAKRAFEAALARRPHPVIRYNLALCWARLGKPMAALAGLRQVLADAQTDKDLRVRSERELRSAEQALAHITFTLVDAAHDRLELDGASVSTPDNELVVDPGSHHVRIISGASIVLDQDLELSPGERVELRVGQRSRRIDVVVVPEVRAPGPAAPVRHAPESAPHRLAPTWFFAAAGTTAVLTGFTIWSALDTQHALSDYQKALPTLTQAEADRRVSDGHARERRTNLLLSGSLIAAAGSAVLGIWFVDFGGARPATVVLGAGRVSVTTQF